MDYAVVVALEILYAAATLALIGAGLAVVFGMMRIVNLAHGELLTLGAYAAIVSAKAGVNIYAAMLLVAPAAAAVAGALMERLVIRRLYGREIAAMLATWGISLLLIGLFSAVFGSTTTGVSAPIGGFAVGDYQLGGYKLFVVAVAAAMIFGLWLVLTKTRAGMTARAAMGKPEMTSALGFNRSRIYLATFTAGAAMTGLAGGVLAPLVGVEPGAGGQFIAKAFITVIAGGPMVVAGLLSSAGLFGFIGQTVTLLSTPAAGEIALLVAAVVLLRLLPRGITGRSGI